jgi:ssDNA-binding Zn-finger/Zn-ribbon topoisomerase 1
MVIKTARRGRSVGAQFWGCSAWPECHYTLDLETGDAIIAPDSVYEGGRREPEFLGVGSAPHRPAHRTPKDDALGQWWSDYFITCVLITLVVALLAAIFG